MRHHFLMCHNEMLFKSQFNCLHLIVYCLLWISKLTFLFWEVRTFFRKKNWTLSIYWIGPHSISFWILVSHICTLSAFFNVRQEWVILKIMRKEAKLVKWKIEASNKEFLDLHSPENLFFQAKKVSKEKPIYRNPLYNCVP